MSKTWLVASALVLTTLGCMDNTPKAFLTPYAPEKAITDRNVGDVFDPKADILFVIDNSGSMGTHQQNLALNMDLFTSVFLKTSIIDYNIGVTTTDPTVSATYCCGRLVGNTRIVTKSTPNASAILKQNVTMIGTNGSGLESPFSTIQMAFEPGNLAGHNAGFLRSKAALIVIFITDAEDQSTTVSSQQLLDSLLMLKGGDKRKVLSYGAIIPSTVTGCERDDPSMVPRKIEEFLKIVPNAANGDNVVSLCAPDYGQRLAEFALQIVDQVSSQIFLSRLPNPKTLKVIYGNAELPRDLRKGWTYNPAMNAILLGPEVDWASQPIGSKLEVRYQEAKGLEEEQQK